MVQKEERRTVSISPVVVEDMCLELKGVTALLMNKFADREKKAMVDVQLKKTQEKKARNIEQEIEEKIHRMPDGKVGFPATGFKKAMTESAPYLTGMNKKLAKGAFLVLGSLVLIKYEKMVVSEERVKIGNGITMIRFRPEFVNWSCTLDIRYNANQISPEQIVNLANLAGFHIGVGDWTPQHSGQYGLFKVAVNGGKEGI